MTVFLYNSRIIEYATIELHSSSPRAITRLLLVQLLFLNSTQMHVITYTNSKITFSITIIMHYHNNDECTTAQHWGGLLKELSKQCIIGLHTINKVRPLMRL